jgi:hypothetical protein
VKNGLNDNELALLHSIQGASSSVTFTYEEEHEEERLKKNIRNLEKVLQIAENVSSRSFRLSTFFHFSQKFLYLERHVRYKRTLYHPGTKRNGKSGKEKTQG